jgi:hypothetical protein
MKMMEWPIVLTCSLQYWQRTEEWSAILPFYSLDRVRSDRAREVRAKPSCDLEDIVGRLDSLESQVDL